ncbi:hypothetical protein [Pseudomonas sp. PDM11]|uniref:hypothetical protein n=1 Tax=Pseudomonas sp. PDM11 TaxID=2769309 RepID=UPI0017853E02|nr:hypothetical protein [Pseudomonas sp. PDM11]MBD9397551.1 hypothetical protein [Pseudomonas sp. PDM11]
MSVFERRDGLAFVTGAGQVAVAGGHSEIRRDQATLQIAMLQWGDKWNPLPDGAPLIALNRHTGAPLAAIQLTDINGEQVALKDLGLKPGPGADQSTQERLRQLREAASQKTRATR